MNCECNCNNKEKEILNDLLQIIKSEQYKKGDYYLLEQAVVHKCAEYSVE